MAGCRMECSLGAVSFGQRFLPQSDVEALAPLLVLLRVEGGQAGAGAGGGRQRPGKDDVLDVFRITTMTSCHQTGLPGSWPDPLDEWSCRLGDPSRQSGCSRWICPRSQTCRGSDRPPRAGRKTPPRTAKKWCWLFASMMTNPPPSGPVLPPGCKGQRSQRQLPRFYTQCLLLECLVWTLKYSSHQSHPGTNYNCAVHKGLAETWNVKMLNSVLSVISQWLVEINVWWKWNFFYVTCLLYFSYYLLYYK